jgi:CheY-like chemotaxis protein
VREYAIGALEDLGYRVLAAADGVAALRLLADPDRIDLLFTDVVLGGAMTGRQLAQSALEVRPSLPVLFTTGYTRNAIVHQGRLDPGVNLLNKPYTQRDLAEKIRWVIDRAAKTLPKAKGECSNLQR